MSYEAVEQIARAVLYEGYLLYPYRASAVKNRQRWNFGGLYPRAYSESQRGPDAWTMQAECLIVGGKPSVEVSVRFLHLLNREVYQVNSPRREVSTNELSDCTLVDSLEIGGRTHYTWQEAIERAEKLDVRSPLSVVRGAPAAQKSFSLPANREVEHLTDPDSDARAVIVRRREQLDGSVEVEWQRLADELYKIRVVVRNETLLAPELATSRELALPFTMASTHVVLRATEGMFVSLMDPPDELRAAAASCRNVGVWPVLVGDEARREFMLASPIILYDFPQVAPESAGDLFDGSEIDEILTLRILTLTDQEKQSMRDLDDRARAILDRSESLPAEQFAKLHGAIRGLRQLQEHR